MRWVVLILVLLAGPLHAQDDRGVVQGLIEDAVSDLGREVRLIGFEGALNSTATVQSITIADEEGIWLQLDGVTLQWTRSALLSGRLEIGELTAQKIILTRIPQASGGNDLAAAEATPFALPELPVSVNIGLIRADRIEVNEAFLGEAVAASLDGTIVLEDGVGNAELALERLDGKEGAFQLDASYSNATRQLALNLLAQEGENGIAARLMNLPGRPSIRLEVAGDAPLDDFAATLALATDGEERFGGEFRLGTIPAENGGQADRSFAMDIAGDVRPLLADRFDPFFGTRSQLALNGVTHGDGRLTLSSLTVGAEQLTLRGSLALGPDYWPERFDLRGSLGSGRADPVTLPVSGDPMTVRAMTLNMVYDSAQGDSWTGRFDIQDLARPGLSVANLHLSGLGTITPGNGPDLGRFTASLIYGADGLALDSPDLSQAMGDTMVGTARLARLEGEPLVLQNLTLSGAGLKADGNAIIKGPDDRLWTRGELSIEAEDFTRFSGLIGQDLTGHGQISVAGDVQPFDGIVDLVIAAQTTDLGIGIEQVDPLLRGQSDLRFGLERDEAGTRLTALRLRGEALSAEGTADLTATSATATFTARLDDLARVVPALSGPATLTADVATGTDAVIALDATLEAPGATVEATGTATPTEDGYAAQGNAVIAAGDLSPYGSLLGQRIAGSLDADISGNLQTDTGEASATVSAVTRELRVGPTGLDPLFRGTGQVSLDLSRSGRGRLRLTGLEARFPNLSATGDVTVTAEGQARADLDMRLADVGLFAPDFSGPASASVEAIQDDAGWQVSGTATGPAGTSARATGRVTNSGDLALSVDGEAPLGLANVYIAPRQISGLARFDLTVSGPAALSSLRGPVTITDARLTAPLLAQAVEDINGTITMGGGTARLGLSGNFAAGGNVTLDGPIDLSPPFQAGLQAQLNRITLRQPALYQTTADGTIRIAGPLSGGATITGQVDLGAAEIRVPSSAVSALGELPEVTHLGPRTEVRRTLERAGQSTDPAASGTATASGRPYPLDILINAPSRIFVRGRGLDAELGGQLRLTGTTDSIVPIGQFSLVRGRLDILGQRFELDEGIAQIQGDFTPFLRLVATTEAATGTTVSIIIEGPADSPQVRFESSPEMPQDEVLAQLLFGRDMSSISPLQAVQLAGAIATLSGRGDGGVLNDLREGLDLDDFDITSDEEGNAAVRAGKYLSDNVYTDITIGADGSSEINLNLDVTDDVTARGSFGNDGETSIGIFYERDY